MNNNISGRLRAVWEDPFATDDDPRSMLLLAANEIDRLQEDAEIARLRLEASHEELARLRQVSLQKNLTDAEREAVEYFSEWCIGPSKRLERYRATLIALLERTGGCTPQLDCGADRKSVASERCRDTGGQPFDSAPITTLTDAERECLEEAIYRVAEHDNEPDGWKSYAADTLRGLLERLK